MEARKCDALMIYEAIKQSDWYQERLVEIEKWNREGEELLEELRLLLK